MTTLLANVSFGALSAEQLISSSSSSITFYFPPLSGWLTFDKAHFFVEPTLAALIMVIRMMMMVVVVVEVVVVVMIITASLLYWYSVCVCVCVLCQLLRG